jgi:hypothetical protein
MKTRVVLLIVVLVVVVSLVLMSATTVDAGKPVKRWYVKRPYSLNGAPIAYPAGPRSCFICDPITMKCKWAPCP